MSVFRGENLVDEDLKYSYVRKRLYRRITIDLVPCVFAIQPNFVFFYLGIVEQ